MSAMAAPPRSSSDRAIESARACEERHVQTSASREPKIGKASIYWSPVLHRRQGRAAVLTGTRRDGATGREGEKGEVQEDRRLTRSAT
jgi:hypothetical protein